MTVDISKIRAGDEITVRCRAHKPQGVGWSVRALHDEMAGTVLNEHILSHTPTALAVGDRVRRKGVLSADAWELLAICGRHAWVACRDYGDVHPSTHPLADLERVS